MTGRSRLEDIYPEAVCEMHPDDAAALGLITGDWAAVSSRRGTITLRVLVTGRSPRGTVFVPFHLSLIHILLGEDSRVEFRCRTAIAPSRATRQARRCRRWPLPM